MRAHLCFTRLFCGNPIRRSHRAWAVGCATMLFGLLSTDVQAQFFNNGVQRQIGGVSVDADGVVRGAQVEDQAAVLSKLRENLAGGKGAFAEKSKLRMISLKAIQAAMVEAAKTGKPLAEEVLLLGGLTRIEMVFVYPDKQDIVIAGPSEAWTIAKDGSIVGKDSGRAIVYLEDLVTAFQSVDTARTEGITCSIDPTPEGSQRLNALLDNVKTGPGFNPASIEPAMREAFGLQVVSLTGLPKTSHMARIIFAADYQMKRYGMNLAEPPVKGLPSYIEMIRSRSVSVPQSRWWMACDYDAVQHSQDGLAWKLSGRGIKTLTEADVVSNDGSRKQTGKKDALAQKWADMFTDKMDELSTKDPVFGELQNVMDTCVVAAIVRGRDLETKSGLDLSVLSGKTPTITPSNLNTPSQIEPQCSFLKTSAGWVVTTSGGVSVDSWSVASKTEVNDELASVRTSVERPDSDSWTWK